MSYQVLARRWRPLTFDAVIGQGPIVRTLQNALARERIAHAYLFAGPRGVGKTTTARLLAMGLNCERAQAGGPVPCAGCEPCREVIAGRALDVIEIDGASNRGIDEVRALRENARYAPARGRRKVYIIDEVHMLTEPAFNALLKTLEEPPAHVVFVLATTEARRLPTTILSRCQRFDFRPISASEIAVALQRIVQDEARGLVAAVEPEALRLIARAADGSLRDALSLLDTALAYGEGQVNAEAVQALLGSGGAEAAWALAEALVRRAAGEALERISRAASEGLDLGLLCQEALEVLRHALLVRIASGPTPELTPDEATRLAALGPEGAGGVDELLLLVKGLLDAEAEMRRSPHPRVDLEVAVVRLCHRPRIEAIEAVLERLEQAEARLRGYGPTAGPPVPVQTDLLGGAPPPRPAPGARPAGRSPDDLARPAAKLAPIPGTDSVSPASPASPTGSAGASGARGSRDLDEVWRQIVAEVTRIRPTLGHVLAEAAVVSQEEGRLTVAVPNGNAFTQDQLRSPGTRELLVEAARRVRPELREVVLTAGPVAGGTGGPAPDHPLLRAALELFNGEVTPGCPGGPRPPYAGAESGDTTPGAGEPT